MCPIRCPTVHHDEKVRWIKKVLDGSRREESYLHKDIMVIRITNAMDDGPIAQEYASKSNYSEDVEDLWRASGCR